jgi:CRP/FNR family cyclic AMP-dependent transcriptional regulator
MTFSETIDFLHTSPLFRDVSEEEIKRMAPQWHHKSVPNNTVLMSPEADSDDVVYLLTKGSVKIVSEGSGRDVVLGLRGAGELLGEISLVDNRGRSATVVTIEASDLLWAAREDLVRDIHCTPQIMHNLARILSSRLRLATAQIRALAQMDVRGRLARQLLALADDCGHPLRHGTLIPLRVTQSDLADMVGASRVSVNQIFAIWKEKEILGDRKHYRIVILDRAALEAEL